MIGGGAENRSGLSARRQTFTEVGVLYVNDGS
jgi:hypothetical protein